MALNAGELIAYLTLNKKEFDTALKGAEKQSTASLKKIGAAMEKVGKSLTMFVTLPILGLGVALLKAAASAEETRSKFNTVFRDIRKEADLVAKNLSENFGLSTDKALELLSSTGDLLTGFGFTQDAALDLSQQVNELAVDLASFTNFSGGAEGASIALTKALLGERESVKSLGISILEVDVKAKVLENAQKGLTFETERQAKAFATLQIAQEQSKNAIGDFARTQESLSNQFRIFKQDLNDLAVSFGSLIVESAAKAVKALREFVQRIIDLDEGTKLLIIRIAAVAAVVGPAILIIGKIITAYTALKTAILASNLAMGATPWGLIALGVAGLAFAIWKLVDASKEEKRLDEEIIELKDQLTRARDEEKTAILETTLAKQKEKIATLELKKAEELATIARRRGILTPQAISILDEMNKKIEEARSEYALLALQIKSAYEQQRESNRITREGTENREEETKIIIKQKDSIIELGDSFEDLLPHLRQVSQADLELTGLMGAFIDKLNGVRGATEEATVAQIEFNDELLETVRIDTDVTILLGLNAEQRLAARIAANAALAEMNRKRRDKEIAEEKKAAKKTKRIRKQLLDGTLSYAAQITGALSNIWANHFAGLLMNEDLTDKERRKIQHDAAITSRNFSLFEGAITGAQAIISGFASKPFLPVGLLMGALASVLVGAQMIAIATQPIPALKKGGLVEFQEGGLLQGKPGIDTNIIAASSGEFMVNREATAQNLGLLEAINQGQSPTVNISAAPVSLVMNDRVVGQAMIEFIQEESDRGNVRINPIAMRSD